MIVEATVAMRRHLPHLENAGKTYFVTFSTRNRAWLPGTARAIALQTVLHDHQRAFWLHGAVIMPDHGHAVFTPLEPFRLKKIMNRLKGVSSHRINKALGRHGTLWEEESFDRILRSDEDIVRKCEYVCDNPVRAGLVASADEYDWLWREWVEGNEENRLAL